MADYSPENRMAAAHLTTASSATFLDPMPAKTGYTAPYSFPRKYSPLTKPRWICFALFLFFAIPAVGLAIDIFQRTPKVPDHFGDIRSGPGPGPSPTPPENDQFIPATPPTVVAWARLPIIELFITSAAIVLSWVLDVWYPLTFISKPRGEVCYFLLTLATHIGTISYTAAILPRALGWLSKTEFPMQAESVNGEAWAMIACMLIQAAILIALCVIITWSTIQHIKDGRRDALYHPTCRFDPNAPPPIYMLGIHHQSMHRIPQSSYTITTNASTLEPAQLPVYPYSIQLPSQEFH